MFKVPGGSPGSFRWAGGSLGNTPRPTAVSGGIARSMARGGWAYSDFTKLFNGLGDVRAAQGVSTEFLSTAESSAYMAESAAAAELRVTALLEEAAAALETSSVSAASTSAFSPIAASTATTASMESVALTEAAIGAEATVAASASAAALSAPMVAAMVVAVAAVVGGIVYLAGGFDDVKQEFTPKPTEVDPRLVPDVGPGPGFLRYQDRSGPFDVDPAFKQLFC